MAAPRLWYTVERVAGIPLRLFFLLMALWVWQDGASPWFRGPTMPAGWGYAAFLLLSALWVWTVGERRSPRWLAPAQGLDLVFLAYTVATSGRLAGPPVWLFGLWVAKQAILATAWPFWYGVTLLAPLAYAGAVYAYARTWTFVWDPAFQQGYALLLATLATGWGLSRYLHALQEALARERADLAEKTRVLQQTASDLGARVLELRALQEIAHQLSSSLHLEEAIDIVIHRAQDLFDLPRVALLVPDDTGGEGQVAWSDGRHIHGRPLPPLPADLIHAFTRAAATTLTPAEETPITRFLYAHLPAAWRTLPLVTIPLVTRRRLVALLVLAPERPTFDERQEQLAESFAFLAATAIENARLYENVLEQRQELEAVLQGIGDAVVVTDAAQKLLLVNPVAQRTFRLGDAALGQPLATQIDNPDLLALIEEALTAPEEVHVRDIAFTFPGEKPRTFQAVASAVRIPARGARAVVTVLRDITAQKELERMKSNFLSVVSHELKTPLHSIKGFVEIIRMGKAGPITELQADFLTTVKEQTQVLQRMIEDLLVFSRLEAGQLHLHVEEVSLAEIATQVVQKLRPIAEEKGLTLDNRVPPDLPDVEGDYMRLEQVLTNLVENAIKFTPSGGRVVLGGEDRGETVCLWVRDTGIGIPESEQERIFERFYQVDASERRAYRGAGLGLTICKHIVERHHGRIWVRSRPGEGSTFYVELPKRLPAVSQPLDFYTE